MENIIPYIVDGVKFLLLQNQELEIFGFEYEHSVQLFIFLYCVGYMILRYLLYSIYKLWKLDKKAKHLTKSTIEECLYDIHECFDVYYFSSTILLLVVYLALGCLHYIGYGTDKFNIWPGYPIILSLFILWGYYICNCYKKKDDSFTKAVWGIVLIELCIIAGSIWTGVYFLNVPYVEMNDMYFSNQKNAIINTQVDKIELYRTNNTTLYHQKIYSISRNRGNCIFVINFSDNLLLHGEYCIKYDVGEKKYEKKFLYVSNDDFIAQQKHIRYNLEKILSLEGIKNTEELFNAMNHIDEPNSQVIYRNVLNKLCDNSKAIVGEVLLDMKLNKYKL